MWTVLVSMLLARALAFGAGIDLASALNLTGSARFEGSVLRLTPAERHLAGAAWMRERQPVANGFEAAFQFQLTGQGGLGDGADGFAFVLQNSGPSALGGRGSGGGFALGEDVTGGTADIPQSIAVFFDTFRNSEIGDPSDNFVSISTAGTSGEMHWPPPRLAASKKLHVKLKDRKVHTASIAYQPPAITVSLDGSRVLLTAVDLSTVLGHDGAAWVGFTASTGEGFENHDILSFSFSRADVSSIMPAVTSSISYLKTECLPNHNLCTPDHVIVEQTAPGVYHIVLPGNLEEGAEIPNPAAQPVTITNARGNVCHDVANLGAEGCVGPAALVQRTGNGRTRFEINLAGGNRDYEGYLEFDARLQ